MIKGYFQISRDSEDHRDARVTGQVSFILNLFPNYVMLEKKKREIIYKLMSPLPKRFIF